MKYGIELGQIYAPADGSLGKFIVVDCEKYLEQDDVVVYDTLRGTLTNIDAFKLAKVRYVLVSPTKS